MVDTSKKKEACPSIKTKGIVTGSPAMLASPSPILEEGRPDFGEDDYNPLSGGVPGRSGMRRRSWPWLSKHQLTEPRKSRLLR